MILPNRELSRRGPLDSRETDKVMDDLCVNTIRTLSMDAVQQANSGHPGTPMALAPVAYCLWQRFLRFDPDIRSGPIATASCLSVGHASMLLYSLLHLTGVKAVNPKYEMLGRPVGHPGRHQEIPPARQQMPGPSGVSLDVGHRDHDGPAGAGCGHQRGHGDRRALDGQSLQSSRLRDVRLRRLRALRRRLHDGRRLRRSGLAGRPSQALQPVLDLRQQPHHHRGQHGAGLHAKTWPRASSATAGTCCASAMPTIWTCLTRAFSTFKSTTIAPR